MESQIDMLIAEITAMSNNNGKAILRQLLASQGFTCLEDVPSPILPTLKRAMEQRLNPKPRRYEPPVKRMRVWK